MAKSKEIITGAYSLVSPRAVIGSGVTIGNFCTIMNGVIIGNNTHIMDYVKLMPGTVIGCNCKLDDYVNTSGYTHIGNNVRIKRCTMIGQACRIDNNVWIGSHVTTTRMKYPKAVSGEISEEEWVHIKEHAVIGSHALILAGVTVGMYALVGAGAIISRDCEPFSVYANQRAHLVRIRCN